MNWVLDASIAASLALPDESSTLADKFIKEIFSGEVSELWVPSLFWFELANIFYAAQKKQRIEENFLLRYYDMLNQLPIKTDFARGPRYSQNLAQLSIERQITSYDVSYLELCQRKAAGLVSADKAMLKQARALSLKQFR